MQQQMRRSWAHRDDAVCVLCKLISNYLNPLSNWAWKLPPTGIFKLAGRWTPEGTLSLHLEAKQAQRLWCEAVCACIVNWRDNKRLQTLWSGTGVDAWRQWEQAQEEWPGAIESRYSRAVSAASLEEMLLWALSVMAGLHTLLAGTWVGQKTDSLKRK